jgi:hypothetical protein
LTPWDLYALLLIALPLPAPEHPPEELWDSLIAVSLVAELADPRENWLRGRPEGMATELRILRMRREELEGTPHSHDGRRWETAAWAREGALAANDARRHHLRDLLESSQLGWREPQIYEELAWLERSNEAWHAVADAAEPTYSVLMRRKALGRLLRLLGPEDYYAGRLPPPVMLWRYPESP